MYTKRNSHVDKYPGGKWNTLNNVGVPFVHEPSGQADKSVIIISNTFV